MRACCALAGTLVAALAFAACGGAEEPPAAAPPPVKTATEPATTADSGTANGAETVQPATRQPEAETVETETEPPEPAEDRFDVDARVEVAGGERVGGPGRVEAKKGDRVRIEIAVDEPQELHLHGYGVSRNATPAKPAVFKFRAKFEGIFELESHLSEAVIVNLVVEP